MHSLSPLPQARHHPILFANALARRFNVNERGAAKLVEASDEAPSAIGKPRPFQGQGPCIILHVILSFAQDLFGWREQVGPTRIC
jgi:hypothetical protein